MQHKPPNVIELFAGAGGMMVGLEKAGFNTVFANEIHADPCKTLEYNFPKKNIICADIRTLKTESLKKLLPKKKEIELLAGGPPCQGFSTAGMKDPTDPRNSMLGEYIRVLKLIRPYFFVLENVTGLMTLHGGNLFRNLLSELNNTGYNFEYKVLYAADYGVPQMRKRLFIIGSQSKRSIKFPSKTHEKIDDQKQLGFFPNLMPFVTCGDAIGDLPQIQPGTETDVYDCEPQNEFQKCLRNGAKRLFNHKASVHKIETMDYYSLIPAGGTVLDIPKELRKKKVGIQRWPLDGLSRTITTEPTDFLHPKLNRVPTVRETARIQTFPDTYVFCGQRTTGNKMRRLGYCSQTQQVGNAVPPILAEVIGRKIYNEVI